MNPGMKLLLVMIIALEISFTQSLTVNIILIGVSLIYILLQRVHMKALFGLLFGHSSQHWACLFPSGCMEAPASTLPGSCLPGSMPTSFWERRSR